MILSLKLKFLITQSNTSLYSLSNIIFRFHNVNYSQNYSQYNLIVYPETYAEYAYKVLGNAIDKNMYILYNIKEKKFYIKEDTHDSKEN